MSKYQLQSATTELLLNWMLDFYIIHADSDGFNYGDDVCLVDKGLIKIADFLLEIGLLKNVGGDELWEQILVPTKLVRLPKLEEAFSYFIWLGDFYGFWIKHPKEGFLVDNSVLSIFEKLTALGYCEEKEEFFFWSDAARKHMRFGDFPQSRFTEAPPEFENVPRVWRKLYKNVKPVISSSHK